MIFSSSFLKPLLFLIGGILVSSTSAITSQDPASIILCCSIPLFFAIFFSFYTFTNWLKNAFLMLFFFCFGYSSHSNFQREIEIVQNDILIEGAFLMRVESAIIEDAKKKKKVDLKIVEREYSGLKVLAILDTGFTLNLSRGDLIVVSGKMIPSKLPRKPYDFDYKKYLAKKGIGHLITINDENIQHHHKANDYHLMSIIDQTRIWAINELKRLIPDSRLNPIAVALVVGEKSLIDRETKENYSKTGLMHVLAVSGMHVGLVYLFFTSILSLFFNGRKSKWTKFLIVVIFLGFYTLFTGFSASVVRACTMCFFAELSKLKRKETNLIHILCSSAFFMLLLKPQWLFELGFQLSFLAVLGIGLLNQPLTELLHTENKVLKFFWSSFCVTISAQLAVTPLTIYYFNAFPTYFVLSNLLVLP
ncbi:MAG: ComEC/Rec2 family competence protein, partial [Cytophagales bacterium]